MWFFGKRDKAAVPQEAVPLHIPSVKFDQKRDVLATMDDILITAWLGHGTTARPV
jgi:hypothetical protein